MLSTCDVAIIGGGAIGLACAWRLAQRGAKVRLFERGSIGREASHAAAGMLAAQCEAAVHSPASIQEDSLRTAFFELCLQSRTRYPFFERELYEATGLDIELSLRGQRSIDTRTPGILFVGEQDDPAWKEFSSQRECGMRVEKQRWLNRRALWLPFEGQVENRKLVAALQRACQNSRVEIYENSKVIRIGEDFIETEAGHISCGKILLCAGSWSAQLDGLPEECLPSVRPVAGEVLSVRLSRPLEHIVYSRDVYLVPRRDGRVLIGATMRETGFDKTPTEHAKTVLLEAARKLLPESEYSLEDRWTGLRPATPDGLPILGNTARENLFVACGHFRNGILLTPITAEIMAGCILENKDAPREFSIERFVGSVLEPCASN